VAGRIRSIKPEILEDTKTASLSHLEYRIFVGSWLLADDHGNLRGDPDYVRGQIVWASRESRETVAKALESLARVFLLFKYTVRGQVYFHVVGWDKHQRVDKPGKPRMPLPTECDQTLAGDSRESREDFLGIPESQETPGPDLRPPTSEKDPDPEGDQDPDRARARRSTKSRPRKAVALSADWTPTEAHADLARERGVDLTLQVRKFKAHAEANARTAVSWNGAFAQWLLNAWPDRNQPRSGDGLQYALDVANGVIP
jgi:hypothetical protein